MTFTQRDVERWRGEAQRFFRKRRTKMVRDYLANRQPDQPLGEEMGDKLTDGELDEMLEVFLEEEDA